MKMSDYFELPVSFDIDLCKIHSPSHNLIEAKAINLEAQCYAINNHDRLTEENTKLREIIWEIVDDCEEDCYNGLSGVVNSKTVEKINQLKDQNNDK